MGPQGIGSLATFLNESAILSEPPASWRTAKIVPVYKGKGDASLPENYRSIAITPPPVEGVHCNNEQPADRDSHIEETSCPHLGRFPKTSLGDGADPDHANDTSS
jgi:hypothetical protein